MLHQVVWNPLGEELYLVKDASALRAVCRGRSGKKQLALHEAPLMPRELLSGPRSHRPRTVIASGTSPQTQVRPRHLSGAAI
eukprot:7990684-Pyramimonas_sp.AAC.1